jgi:hypothetical protein
MQFMFLDSKWEDKGSGPNGKISAQDLSCF